MKKALFLVIWFLLSIPVCGETLLNSENITANGLYVSGITKKFASQPYMVTGGHLVWVFNHKYVFGFAGYGSNRFSVDEFDFVHYQDASGDYTNADYEYAIQYSGLVFERIYYPDSLIHFGFIIFSGNGSIEREPKNIESYKNINTDETDANSFSIAEFGFYVEINLHENVRLSLGVEFSGVAGGSFEFPTELDAEPQNPEIGGASIGLELKLGQF